MGLTIAEKIISRHLAGGEMKAGREVALRVDQTLTQDATGTMAYLEFETLGLPRVKVELGVSYVDHNTLQGGFENADDHRFLQTFASRYGLYFSRPGNGICHQIHLERFGRPGAVLLGSDSHTPTGGGLGMLAIGVGGLEIAAALAGRPYSVLMPEIFEIRLEGSLRPWVSAKDVILAVLRELSVKGGVGKILEYTGPGVESLSVPERATIANMGAETGATTSVFPSDRRTREFLAEQGREEDWTELNPDPSASYAARLLLNLDSLEPLAACPHSPDRVRPVRELAGIEVDQVCIGSCTNSSWKDLATAAAVLEGKVVPPRTSLVISPGSRQVMSRLARDGGLDKLISAGARIMENACGPCIGMGQAPPSRGVSLRTYNRNFKGRSGTADAEVYLVSPETAAVSALRGAIVDPREAGTPPVLPASSPVTVDDSMIVPPSAHPETVEVVKGPNISSVPLGERLPVSLEGRILTRVGDNVTTDDIMPAGARILPLRSNIEKISRYVFRDLDPGFVAAADRARRDEAAGVIVGGENYGQGSSREHAALAPRYLGVRAVLARSFARIHRANLINFGILPLVLSAADAETLPPPGAQANFPALREETEAGAPITVDFPGQGRSIRTVLLLSPREREIVLAGGLLNLLKLESGAG